MVFEELKPKDFHWPAISYICDRIRDGEVTPDEMRFFREYAHPDLFRIMMEYIFLRKAG